MSEARGVRAGVIGLGDIGRGVARSCLEDGLKVSVCDIRAEALAPFADEAVTTSSPAELARDCDVVVIAVVNDAQVLSVTTDGDGVLSTATPGTVLMVVSTISPTTLVRVAEAAAAVGVRVVDCGVSGGPSAAAAGELICMVGGDEQDLEVAAPVLDAMGSLVVRMGDLGTGLIAKLARNAVQYGGWLAAYEGAQIAEAAGVEIAKLVEVIKASDAKIGGVTTLLLRPTVEQFGPDDDKGFIAAMAAGASLAAKDLAAALATAHELGLTLPGVAATEEQIPRVFGVAEVESEEGR